MINKIKNYIKRCNEENNTLLPFGQSFNETCNFYYFTNENIDAFFQHLDFSNDKNALTVCGSGDHIFNLINQNISEIDTFDTNNMAAYYTLGIKSAAIKSLDYQQFLNFFNNMVDENTSAQEQYELFNIIKNKMDEPYKSFWEEIFLFNKSENFKIPLFKILGMNYNKLNTITTINPYLKNEKEYNKTKSNLNNTIINFKNVDILSLNKQFDKKYDKIILSNILDYLYHAFGYYWEYKDLEPQLINNFNQLLTPNGKLILAYIFKFASNNEKIIRTRPISSSSITSQDLSEFNIIPIESANKELKDGIIISK